MGTLKANATEKPRRYGLYGEADFLLPDYVHCEPFEYRSAKNNWVIEPHLHAHLFQVFLIEGGEVFFTFGAERQLVSAHSLVAIPENNLHALEVSRDVKGLVLTLSSDFLEVLFQTAPAVLAALNEVLVLRDLRDQRQYQVVQQALHALHEELQDEQPEQKMVLQSYFNLLLCGIFRLSAAHTGPTIRPDSRGSRYFREFQRKVKQTYNPQITIRDYARELDLSPVHLNRVCQAVVGKSAQRVVHDYFFIEAKKYLLHTEYAVSEIAYRLNFEDPAYFSRFFKKQAGLSPRHFRESQPETKT
jgi:AraC family transcriptional regulator, transcriptional activator of pobA